MSRWPIAALLLVPLAAASVPQTAPGSDVLCLHDGRIVEGLPLERREGGVAVKYPSGEVFVADALIRDAILAADAAKAPADSEEAAQRANGMVKFEGRWIPAAQREKLLAQRLAQRRADAAETKARLEWRNRAIVETRMLRFEHQLSDHVFAEYRDSMEAFIAVFSKTWKLETPKDKAKLPVNIYIDRENFNQVAGVSGGVLAYFRFKTPYDLNGYHDRLDPDYSKQVFYHEFTHYLEKLVDIEFAYPHFPNESVAEYYGASRWDAEAKKFTTGMLQEGRLWEIQTDIASGERMQLERLVSTDRMYEHYNWGWSLVHYLMNQPKLKPKFERFFLNLSKGKGVRRRDIGFDNLKTCEGAEVWRLFREEFALKDADAVRKFEVDWHNYVEGLIEANTSVSGKEKAAFAAQESGRPIRAKRFFQEAVDGGSKNARVFLEYGEMLQGDGKPKEALAMFDRGIALDPFNGRFYRRKAWSLEGQGKKDEAKLLKQLAKEVGGDDPEILIELEDAGEGEDKPKGG